MADWISLLGAGPTADDIGTAFTQGRAQAAQLQNAQIEATQKRAIFEQQQQARSRIGELIRTGDYTGAAATAYAAGDKDAGTGFVTLQKNVADQSKDGAGAFGEIVRGVSSLPYEQRRAALAAAKPTLLAMGYKPDAVDAFDPTNENLATVSGLGYSAHDRASDTTDGYKASTDRITANNPVVVGGSLVTRGGQELYRSPEYINAPLGNNVYEVGGTSSNGYTGGGRSYAPGQVTAESLYFGAIKPQESGGMPNGGAGAIGQPTKWGRAQGSSQMLPSTAKDMAKRAGIPWRPDLMVAKTEEGLKYQDRLGVEYTKLGLEKSGGDPRGAAMFYHGGPNPAQHGRRTNRYADEVVQRFERSLGNQATTRPTRQIQQGVPTGKNAKTGDNAGREGLVIDSYDRAIRTGKALLVHPGLPAAVGSAFDPAAIGRINPLTGKPFGGTNAANFIATLESMKSQVFLPMVQALRGMGALSNTEGERLTSAIGALDTNMSEDQFKASVTQIVGDLETYKARAVQQKGAGGASSGGGGGASGPNAAQVERLRQNPALREAFDQKFGTGASARVLGQ